MRNKKAFFLGHEEILETNSLNFDVRRYLFLKVGRISPNGLGVYIYIYIYMGPAPLFLPDTNGTPGMVARLQGWRRSSTHNFGVLVNGHLKELYKVVDSLKDATLHMG